MLVVWFFFRLQIKLNGLAQYLGTHKCCYKNKTVATKPENLSALDSEKPSPPWSKFQPVKQYGGKEGLAGLLREKNKG